jgi:hypothetical protein
MRRALLVPILAACCAAALRAHAETGEQTRYITGFYGRSQLILGSEDPRHSGGIAYGIGWPNRRLRFRSIPARLVLEGYYEHSESPGASGLGPDRSDAFGALAYAHYQWPKRGGVGVYANIGWGLQWADHRTVDLDSQLNSTPVFGLGLAIDTHPGQMMVGFRLLHLSNAGLLGDNQGQNQLFFTLGFQF